MPIRKSTRKSRRKKQRRKSSRQKYRRKSRRKKRRRKFSRQKYRRKSKRKNLRKSKRKSRRKFSAVQKLKTEAEIIAESRANAKKIKKKYAAAKQARSNARAKEQTRRYQNEIQRNWHRQIHYSGGDNYTRAQGTEARSVPTASSGLFGCGPSPPLLEPPLGAAAARARAKAEHRALFARSRITTPEQQAYVMGRSRRPLEERRRSHRLSFKERERLTKIMAAGGVMMDPYGCRRGIRPVKKCSAEAGGVHKGGGGGRDEALGELDDVVMRD